MNTVKVAPSKNGTPGKRGWIYIDKQSNYFCDMPKIHIIENGNSICFHNIKNPDESRDMEIVKFVNHEFSCNWCKQKISKVLQ